MDKHITWRAPSLPQDPADKLRQALLKVLGRN
jgi:hypothetical protein